MKLPALQAPNTFWITRLLNNLSQLQLITLHDQNCQIQFYKIDLWLPFLTTIPLLLVIAESSLIFLVNEGGFHLEVHNYCQAPVQVKVQSRSGWVQDMSWSRSRSRLLRSQKFQSHNHNLKSRDLERHYNQMCPPTAH